jgi:hypothetical protein
MSEEKQSVQQEPVVFVHDYTLNHAGKRIVESIYEAEAREIKENPDRMVNCSQCGQWFRNEEIDRNGYCSYCRH